MAMKFYLYWIALLDLYSSSQRSSLNRPSLISTVLQRKKTEAIFNLLILDSSISSKLFFFRDAASRVNSLLYVQFMLAQCQCASQPYNAIYTIYTNFTLRKPTSFNEIQHCQDFVVLIQNFSSKFTFTWTIYIEFLKSSNNFKRLSPESISSSEQFYEIQNETLQTLQV